VQCANKERHILAPLLLLTRGGSKGCGKGGADTGSLGMEVTQRGPGAEPLVEVRGNPPPKMGVWAEVWG